MTAKSAIDCPVRLLHGDDDEEVPLDVAFRTVRALRSADVQLNVIKGGGHRLSAPHEIDAIVRTVDALMEPAPDDPRPRRRRCRRRTAPPPAPTSTRPTRSSAVRWRRRSRRSAGRGPGVRRSGHGLARQGSENRAACAPRPAICGSPPGQPGKAAFDLDRALALPGLEAEQRGEALLDRARAAEAQGDLKTARARLNEARAQRSPTIPFYWYFSAALAIRENDAADGAAGDRQGADACAQRPRPSCSRPATSPISTATKTKARELLATAPRQPIPMASRQGGAPRRWACSPSRRP